MSAYHVYILASKRNGTLYTGVTSDLATRIHNHKSDAANGFTKTYGVKTLVHVEPYDTIEEARQREHSMKRWKRAWKIDLIEKNNPAWRDLTDDILS